MDYILNVYAGNEFVCCLGGKHMNYDNVIWWQLSKVIKEYRGKKITKEELQNTIETVSEYFVVLENVEAIKGEPSIDLINETIEKPELSIYNFDEVTKESCDFSLVKENGKYWSQYDVEQLYPMENVSFNEDLLNKKVVSFNELLEINEFVETLSDREYILNNNKVLVLNLI